MENQYSRLVKREGNLAAQSVIHEIFETTDRVWRGLGLIPMQRLWTSVKNTARFNAENKFLSVSDITAKEDETCISGLILQGARNHMNVRRSATGAFQNIR